MQYEVWEDVDFSDFKGLPTIRFKGGSSQTTSRNIPGQTWRESTLENGLFNYGQTGLNNANSIQGMANNAINGIDWDSLVSGSNDLLSGNLPSTFANARQQALNSDLQGTMGNAISNLASRGILNSSVTNSALNNISQNTADTLAKNYTNDLGTYAGLLNNASNVPSQLTNLSNSMYSPASNLYNTMYSGRMGTGSTTTKTNDGGSGTWQAVGGIGSALITCFAAGTKISTPTADINIEDIAVGDRVYSLDGTIETVTNIMPPGFNDIYDVETTVGNILCTASQPFVTKQGIKTLEELDENTEIITKTGTAKLISISQLPPAAVYDFTVSGSGIFFANGIAVEGWE